MAWLGSSGANLVQLTGTKPTFSGNAASFSQGGRDGASLLFLSGRGSGPWISFASGEKQCLPFRIRWGTSFLPPSRFHILKLPRLRNTALNNAILKQWAKVFVIQLSHESKVFMHFPKAFIFYTFVFSGLQARLMHYTHTHLP